MKNRSPLLKKLRILAKRLLGIPQWVGEWEFSIVGVDGKVKESWTVFNALADEGEQSILDSYFRAQNTPTSFFLRLFNDTPAETDTLADLLNEPSGNGYSAITLARNTTDFPTLALDSGDYRVSSKQVTFTASGGTMGTATYAVLATSSDNSGKLIAYVALATTRTLLAGESLNVTFRAKLQ